MGEYRRKMPTSLSIAANVPFAGASYDKNNLKEFLAQFGKEPNFCHAAVCRQGDVDYGQSGARVQVYARLTSCKNGGVAVYISGDDVHELMQELRKSEHKYYNDAGRHVTRYPELVEALLEAKMNIALYEAPEMQVSLKRSFATHGGDSEEVSRSEAGVHSVGRQVSRAKRSSANLALVKA